MNRRRNIPLIKQMKQSGRSYGSLAAQLGSGITRFDVSNFLHRRFDSISNQKKIIIRRYFQSIGWIKIPTPRKPPVCRRCGIEYPTRKLQKRNLPGNHKRTTKVSQ